MAAPDDPTRREAGPLWGVLDLLLEAYATARTCDPEVAHLAMMTALVLGERLGLSDRVVDLMGQSAAAAKQPAGIAGRRRRR